MLYFMRHGPTDWNAQGRLQGHTDIPLSEQGREEMRRMGQRLREADFSVDRIVTSPLKRARETARIIAEQIGFAGEIRVEPELIERCFGEAEGKIIAQLDLSMPVSGMESAPRLCRRVERVLERYTRVPGMVLLVTHGAFIQAAMDIQEGRNVGEDYRRLVEQGNPMLLVTEDGQQRWDYFLRPQ